MTESDEVIALRDKLKAIEQQRELAKHILYKNFYNERGHYCGFSVERAIDAMLEFHEAMKKTGI